MGRNEIVRIKNISHLKSWHHLVLRGSPQSWGMEVTRRAVRWKKHSNSILKLSDYNSDLITEVRKKELIFIDFLPYACQTLNWAIDFTHVFNKF